MITNSDRIMFIQSMIATLKLYGLKWIVLKDADDNDEHMISEKASFTW